MHALVPHPSTPPRGIEAVGVQLCRSGRPGALWLEYHVVPAKHLLLPAETGPERTDGLWRATCFELFAKPVGTEAYFEFNFSPSSAWAAYGFQSYRTGMSDLPWHDPEISVSSGETHFFLAVEAMPALPAFALDIALSAVIEETDGTKSYWALRHPPERPDFHHPDGFALELGTR